MAIQKLPAGQVRGNRRGRSSSPPIAAPVPADEATIEPVEVTGLEVEAVAVEIIAAPSLAPGVDPNRGTCTCPRPWPITHSRFVRGKTPGSAGRQETYCGDCGAVQGASPMTDVGIKERNTR